MRKGSAFGADDRSESGMTRDVGHERAMGAGGATNRRFTVACLAGDGVGPELMGEASRALTAVARLHALRSTTSTCRSAARR